jgi:hypothetical protein
LGWVVFPILRSPQTTTGQPTDSNHTKAILLLCDFFSLYVAIYFCKDMAGLRQSVAEVKKFVQIERDKSF